MKLLKMKGDNPMHCPNCGKELLEGEVCSCTIVPADDAPININEAPAPEMPIQEAPIQEAPVQEQPPMGANPYYEAPSFVPPVYDPNQAGGYYAPNQQAQQPFYSPITMAPPASKEYPEGYNIKKKYVVVILAATLGMFGAHNFYLGNSSRAIGQLILATVGSLFFGLGLIAAEIWALVEAIQILTDHTDADANGYKIMTLAEEIAREQKKD